MKKTAFSRRLLAILLVAAMCLSVMPMMVFAEEDTVTFTNSDFAGQGTVSTGSPMSSSKSDVTLSCDKGYGDGGDHFRCYNGAKISVTANKTISKIEMDCTAGNRNGDANNNTDTKIVYENINSTVWERTLPEQARIKSFVITFAGSTTPHTKSVQATAAKCKPVVFQKTA